MSAIFLQRLDQGENAGFEFQFTYRFLSVLEQHRCHQGDRQDRDNGTDFCQ